METNSSPNGTEDGPTTFEIAAVELIRVVEPLATAVDEGPTGIIEFIDETGVGPLLTGEELEQVVTVLEQQVGEPIAQLYEFFDDGTQLDPKDVREILGRVVGIDPEDPDPEDLMEGVGKLVEPIDSILSGIQELSELQFQHENLDEAGERVLNHLLVRYLRTNHVGLHRLMRLTNVVELPDGAKPWDDGVFEPANLGTVLTEPNEAVRDATNWGSREFRDDLTIEYLRNLFGLLGILTRVEPPVTNEQAELVEGAIAEDPANSDFEGGFGDQLAAPFVRIPNVGVFGVRIVPVPETKEHHQGFALVPYGPFDQFGAGFSQGLGDDWTFEVELGGQLEKYGFLAQPTKPDGTGTEFQFRALDAAGATPLDEAHARAALSRDDDDPGDHRQLIGSPGGSGLTLGSVAARAALDYENETLSIRVELPVSGRLVVSPEGGFLAEVLPEDVAFDFDATVGWSNLDGLYFEGGGTLSASIPMHLDFGFGSIDELYLAIDPTSPESDFTIDAATSPTIALGPLTGSVRRLGLSAAVSFPPDRDGNVGPLDLELGFRPPDGIALSVDTGPITGGGFLVFEPDDHRYSGGLQLQFSSWGLSVLGLLNTEVPRTDGYSLLLLVTADLPPIQLGFGFVMTGIGGLAGIHRGFEKQPLGNAVRSGNLDSVLFPENVVENANQIITDLRAIFPVKADRHVFGPMVRLGWGTPVIIQAELGVLVSIPDWKITLLGKFMLDLPDEEMGLVDVNLAVVGVLDIPAKELAIDASLYDSRLASWAISGDMAMRLSWGSDSRFMLSIGGFHPRYSPPSDFPELDRVTATLSPPGGNPRLEYTGYLAVTPNTFQVGAGAVLRGKFGPARVHGELSFDALFRFDPFEFVVDFLAKVAVRISGSRLGLKLDGTLSGPGPYRVRGKLSIDILFLSVTVNVNASFGSAVESKELPTANVLPELVRELRTTANWSAQRPEGGDQLVTLRDPSTETAGDTESAPKRETVLAHPLGTLGVRQQVVPLGVEIEKYGNAMPTQTLFELGELSVTGIGRDLGGQTQLREKFAPATFRNMSDSEKLEAAPFEQLPAGRRVENDAVHYAGREDDSLLSWATLEYESSVIDEETDQYRLTVADVDESWNERLDLSTGHQLAEESAVGQAETRTTGPKQYANPGQTLSASVSDQHFAVAWKETLSRLEVTENPPEGSTRVEAEDCLRRYVATDSDTDSADLIVVGVQELAGAPGGESS